MQGVKKKDQESKKRSQEALHGQQQALQRSKVRLSKEIRSVKGLVR